MEPDIVQFCDNDPRMKFAIDEASRSLKTFLYTCAEPKPSQTNFLLKVRFEANGIIEHIWLADIDLSVFPTQGTVANKTSFPGLDFMKRVTFMPDQITDWMYLEDGFLVGGFTIRVVRDGLSPEQRADYDARLPFKIK